MEALRNTENQNPFAIQTKNVRGTSNALRKPLRGMENKIRNLPSKASFKDKTKIALSKENVKNPKLPAAKLDVKKEVLQNVVELQACLPDVESFSSKQMPVNVEDIDAEDKENPQLVSCFINDIYNYMRKLECVYPIKKQHLALQPEITGKMRAVLIDWLVQVHLRFQLLQETLYMTVSILDRYLQAEKVERSRLQLAGVTAMFIASKYEEMYANDISDFVYITDNSYTKLDILTMEKSILKCLQFNLSKPLPLHFLRRNSKAGNVDATVHTLAKYVMEVALPEYELAHYSPSLLAAAALYLSLRLMADSPNPWTETLEYYSNCSEQAILPIVRSLCKILVNSEKSKLQAIRMKYSSRKLFKISTIPQLKSSTVIDLANMKK